MKQKIKVCISHMNGVIVKPHCHSNFPHYLFVSIVVRVVLMRDQLHLHIYRSIRLPKLTPPEMKLKCDNKMKKCTYSRIL
jgi:hypothetical protein